MAKDMNKIKLYLKRNNLKRIAAMFVVLAAVVSTGTGCSHSQSADTDSDTDSVYQTLDVKQLESETTDVNDRADYYDKNVDNRIEEMTDEEKEKFYVNLTVTYTGRENYDGDYIIFLRNDNVYEGDLYDGDDTIGLAPGVYRIISSKADDNGNFGEIYILTPGEDVTMSVDYNSFKATITNDENTK